MLICHFGKIFSVMGNAKRSCMQVAALAFFTLIVTSFRYGIPTKTFVGLEEMCSSYDGKKDCYTDPSKPKYKWYRLSKLTFRGDSVFLEQSPVAIYKKDTLHSASDGGFYYYKGTYEEKADSIVINLRFHRCDYCPQPVGPIKPNYRAKFLTAKKTDNGFIIDGYLFKEAQVQE